MLDFVDRVLEVLGARGLGPELLEIVITRVDLADRDEIVLGTLERLRGYGVRIALDDFGTGYSSLSYLTCFAFDTIKIDQSFVRDLADRSESAAVIEAVTLMARAFAMEVTAEGVESVEQLDLLRANRCDSVRGYL